jgi:predicted anti-sigma-YlaC factor YlaD
MGAVRTAECERARTWVSLALDGELSEVEEALLRAHVGRCADCARFERDADALTRELRAAPLEAAAVAVMSPRRRSAAMRVLRVGAAAAAVALAAGLGSLAGSLNTRHGATFTVAASGSRMPGERPLAYLPAQRLPSARMGRSVAL